MKVAYRRRPSSVRDGQGRFTPRASNGPVSGLISGTDGAAPAGWTWRWHTADGPFTKETKSAIPVIAQTGGTDARRFLSLDAITDQADVEVKARVRTTDIATYQAGLVVRGAGTSHATATGYIVVPYSGAWYLGKYVNGTVTESGQFGLLGSTALPVNTWHWIRLRVSGSTISAKTWPDGGAEPGSFHRVASDAALASGRIGLFAYQRAAGVRDWADFSYALNGGTA